VKATTDWLLLGSIVLLGAALVWVVGGTLEPKVINAGDLAPDFKVVTDQGKTITRSDFGGKLLVLNFWASWCPPCVTETPSLEKFAEELAPQGVVVLGVSSDRNADRYRKFIQRFGITFPTALDPSADISASYGTFQIPETYLIDRNGKVLEKVISNQNWMDPEFVARVKRML
jgi:cytochrome c biogenesis protein CcmG, thiol:disulfide interchange protein DsbE